MTTPTQAEQTLVTLAGVAELARVSRPVASMWRRRFAAGDDAFPAATARLSGTDAFDIAEVAEWLTRTSHGNNPDARADAAVAAVPAGFSYADPQAVAELEGLVALQAQTGALADLTVDALRDAGDTADPTDAVLRREIDAHADRGAPWLRFTDALVDATFSPAAALAQIRRRHGATLGSAGSAGRLHADAIALAVDAVRALAGGDAAVMLDPLEVDLSAAVAAALGDESTLAVPEGSELRAVRRRLLVEGLWLTDAGELNGRRTVNIARIPARPSDDLATMLSAVDDVALTLRDSDAAVILGPARALTDALGASEEKLRAAILRTGAVRGIVRLTPGLVESAPRESLALWVLGAPTGEVPIADRFTVVSDLRDATLTPATRADAISDIVASMGGARDVRAHAFRFARFAKTATLLARGGSLVGTSVPRAATRPSPADLPALIDAAATRVRADLTPIGLAATSTPAPAPASIGALIDDGHLRVIAGTRLEPGLRGEDGLVVVSADDLTDPRAIGATRVDQLAFAARHPSASLTQPGDVVFRTAPSAAAWVDTDGSKVVAYPARILRVTAGDPGGLVPEVIAADIAGATPGPGAWRRWMIRRVAPHTIAPLRAALADISAARAALAARIAHLETYADLIVAGATSGAVTLNPPTPAADAASLQ